MADYIYTVSGKRFYPLSPKKEDIDIKDIAHSLSMLARANGHFPIFHSVAQHSLECANEAIARGESKKVALACLLHDSSEAYMSDVTTPVKDKLDTYKMCEQNLINMVFDKFTPGLTEKEKETVFLIDKILLYHEFYHFMKIELGEKCEIFTNPDFSFKSFEDTKNEFLHLFNELTEDV